MGCRNNDLTLGEEPVTGQEGISVGGQSPDDKSGSVLQETAGKIGNEGEGMEQ
jgi:hypothetical protein